MVQHIERVRYVSGNYGEIQGLRVLPLGFWFLLVALGESGYDASGWMPTWGILAIYFGFLILAFALWAVIGFAYERTYGSVLEYASGGVRIHAHGGRTARALFVVLAIIAVLVSPPTWLFGAAMAWVLFIGACSAGSATITMRCCL